MQKIKWMMIVLVCMMTFTTSKMSLGDAKEIKTENAAAVDNEITDDIGKLQSLGEKHDFVGLEEYAEKLQKKWSKRDWNNYVYVLYKISSAFNSYYFDNDKSYSLARMYAMLALSDTRPLTLERESDFVTLTARWFINLQKCPCGKDILKMRSQEIQLWFHGWKRIESGIDPNYKFIVPYLNPPIQNKSAGAAPQDNIETNAQKAQKLNEQITLRRVEKSFLPRAQKFIIFVYSQLPDGTQELQDYLDKNVADKTKQKEIMDAVKANLARAKANKQ